MNGFGTIFAVVGSLAATAVAVILVLLWRKGNLTSDYLEKLKELAETQGLNMPEGSLLDTLSYYCRLAVLAVEQLVKSGQIDKDDATRREKALEIVEQCAGVDGIELSYDDKEAAKSLIEVGVYELKQNQVDTHEVAQTPEKTDEKGCQHDAK